METLQIALFGHVSVVHPHANGPLKLSRSTQAFFAYLLLQQNLVSRDALMDVFWVCLALQCLRFHSTGRSCCR